MAMSREEYMNFEDLLTQRLEEMPRVAATHGQTQERTDWDTPEVNRYQEGMTRWSTSRVPRNALISNLRNTNSPDLPVLTPQVETVTMPRASNPLFANVTQTGARFAADPGPPASDYQERFFNTVEHLLQQFVSNAAKPNVDKRREPIHRFSGRLEEDPVLFINAMEDYLHDNSIFDDRERFNVIRAQLGGDARTWINAFSNTYLSYTALKDSFLQKFNSPDNLVAANVSLFADKQGARERVDVFISRKRELMARLRPNINLETAIGILTTQIRPEIGTILRGIRPGSLDELLRAATSIELGLENNRGPIATRTVPTNNFNNTNNRDQNVNQANSNNNQNNFKINNNNNRPPNPCMYCQGWHYNRDCPRRNSGNGRQAGEAANRNPPTSTNYNRGQTHTAQIHRANESPRYNNNPPTRQINRDENRISRVDEEPTGAERAERARGNINISDAGRGN